MMKIKKVRVERFRSINALEIKIDQDENIIAICGKNNVGKTNFLRAMNLFFYPEQYDKQVDMTTLKKATGGGTTHPKISITFFDETKNMDYEIVRDINKRENGEDDLYGSMKNSDGHKNKINLQPEEIKDILNLFDFVYIESINIILPQLINDISNEVIDAKYYKARFANTKSELKKAYDTYIDGLKGILDSFAADISETFNVFQSEWKVKFNVPKNSDSFRELISNDVTLQLDDSGSVGIEDKGAGLQRLTAILLQFELLARKKNKKYNIVCIDEPDVYIHEGLQRNLREFLKQKTDNSQLFMTTHSKVFLNEYTMKNVFLFDANYRVQWSQRKKKDINVVETYLVDIGKEDGYKKICEHLGIEIKTYEPLEDKNIIVEGGCDKKYISQLARFYGFNIPNIVSADGADNIYKFLNFYNGYYSESDKKPIVKVVLDNDSKGRSVFDNINANSYKNIQIKKVLLKNFMGETGDKNVNYEIEDLMYPEVVVYLVNQILEKKMKGINSKNITNRIQTPAFKKNGILALIEHEKNENNPEKGVQITISSSDDSSFKKGMAGMFEIGANKNLITLIEECDKKYPCVREFINNILTFE